MLLHIIYAGAEIILSKESFDYTDLHPSAREQVNALLASTSLTAKVRFGC